MRWVLARIIEAYQLFLSPLVSGLGYRCRFHPTCSEYAKAAIENCTPSCAAKLIIRRILRCGTWSEGGVDELPIKIRGEI